ncbi:carbonic anhydrase-like isoform X2 [Tigriopus californicus]|uniref:carbonic anhydrase-like isoform X2 n=1 Tax=Tigriopus californicus TaxID=6832 RepID=UPI0027DA1227|nr:carbonic anhydrase-like isoform X2 [Tigriopus californicus]
MNESKKVETWTSLLKRNILDSRELEVQLDFSEEQRKDMTISCGPFGADQYRFLQLHFHWGANDSSGSEHTFGQVRFPAEMHWVHYNMKYGSPSEAILQKDGLAVLGFMVDVDNGMFNPDFEVISSAVPKLGKAGSTADIELNIFDLWTENPLPLGSYYSYAGSLTTPACSEVVTWVVFTVPVVIPPKGLLPFRDLVDSEGDPMVDNFRPIQPLNGRKVSSVKGH